MLTGSPVLVSQQVDCHRLMPAFSRYDAGSFIQCQHHHRQQFYISYSSSPQINDNISKHSESLNLHGAYEGTTRQMSIQYTGIYISQLYVTSMHGPVVL